jgi:hypothetical protein
MGLLDKAKAAAEQAAAKAKEGVEDVQTKRELGQAYGELGKTTFDLIESGELSHPQLETLAAKIRGLNEAAAGDEAPAGATTPTHDPSQPPAMPT